MILVQILDSYMTTSDSLLPVTHTPSFPAILAEIGHSLVVSGYQANKLILMSAVNEQLAIEAHSFDKPMGIAVGKDRLAIATRGIIKEYSRASIPPNRIDPDVPSDAHYVPLTDSHTGKIDIHEMAYLESGLTFVNTRFSCLCNLADGISFKPIWRPPTVSAYDAMDTCHLNGLGVRDGIARYATSLGISNEPFGWRKNTSSGGVLLDIESDEILASGLSMPHSPRWHRDAIWYLESGKGAICTLSTGNNETQSIASLPGFTRGLSFFKNLAFVGVSRARGTSEFSGIEITKEVAARDSGIWVIDTNNGNTLAALKFGNDIDEVFSVELMPHKCPALLPYPSDTTHQTFILDKETVKNFRQQDPNWVDANKFYEKAEREFENGEFLAAAEEYRKALLADPSHDSARLKLSEAYQSIGAYEEARRELQQLVTSDIGFADGWGRLGMVLCELDQEKEAIDALSKAIDLGATSGSYLETLDLLRR